MYNNCENCKNREWLEVLIKDSFREGEGVSLIGVSTPMLKDSARSIIWNMSRYFGLNNGVEGNTSRIFEQYVASLMSQEGIEDADQVIQIVGPELPLIAACCFQLATKALSARAGITHASIIKYFESMGINQYTVSRIYEMEIEIFKKIGYRLPLYTCRDMAEMLAVEVKIPAPTLKLVTSLVEASEARRSLIENALLAVVNTHYTPTHCVQIKTLHLAASCVVAASQCDLGLSEAMRMAERLERLLRLRKVYITTLANVILAETAGQPSQYCFDYGLANPYEDCTTVK